MDPREVFATDRGKFDHDLSLLIDTAAAAAATAESSSSSHVTSPSTAPTSPPTDPRLRKRPLAQPPAVKKVKLENSKAFEKPNDSDVDEKTQADDGKSLNLNFKIEESDRPQDLVQFSGTGANNIPLVSRRDSSNSTWNTLRNAVRRQWDTRKDDLAYEQLVEKRRAERLFNVDRYIPGDPSPTGSPSSRRPSKISKPFPFTKLPEKVQDEILALVLVGESPLTIDFTWLRPFMHGHCRVPSTTKTSKIDGVSYSIPLEWTKLIEDVGLMQKDCNMFKDALEVRGNKTRKLKSPCRSLTTGVLRISKDVHAQAARVFYGQNVFHFPWATSAWMQLESFLATIGPVNVGHLRNIRIHAPLWHRGIQEDFVEGALLDLTSPASRLGVVKPAARDRLLSAIGSSVQALLKTGKLENFSLDLEHGMVTDRWTGRYSNDRQLIAMADTEEHVVRKQQGIDLLKKLSLSKSLLTKPKLSLHHPSPSAKIAKHDLSEFRSRLASVIREAEKYGWKVEQHLHGGRR